MTEKVAEGKPRPAPRFPAWALGAAGLMGYDLSGTELGNSESGDSESCDSKVALSIKIGCDSDGDTESMFRDSTLRRFDSFFLLLAEFLAIPRLRLWNRAIRDSVSLRVRSH